MKTAAQFVDFAQQRRASELGMWVFLASEVLFFGGLFLALSIYRWIYPGAFAEGTRHLSFALGTLNTGVLLTSSWTIAMAVHRTEQNAGNPSAWLKATAGLGLVFLGIKATEYRKEWVAQLVPVWNFDGAKLHTPHAELFFLLYFLMTLLHAVHLTIGIGAVTWLHFRNGREPDPDLRASRAGVVSLYWHFVDLIWVFLYPALYLIGRS